MYEQSEIDLQIDKQTDKYERVAWNRHEQSAWDR